jgi:polyisoprenoid-binding protein YceI
MPEWRTGVSQGPCCTIRGLSVICIDRDYNSQEDSLSHKRMIFPTAFLLVSAFVTLLVSPALAQVESWKIDPAHSSAQFAVRHLGISTVRGEFRKVSGSASYDPADPSKTSLEATIDATSVDTRVDMRDNDLRSPNFLDVQKYPTITFKSKRAEPAGPGKMKITGDLTIHGVTKEAVLDVEGPSAPVKDPKGNFHVGASASTTIKRKDFGVNGAPAMVGDDISITIDVELVKQ